MPNQEWQADVTRLRANLRRSVTAAKKKNTVKAWEQVALQCSKGFAYFDEYGYPDWWHEFDQCQIDVHWAIRSLGVN